MPVVVEQLSALWSLQLIKLLFDPLFSYMSSLVSLPHSNANMLTTVSPSPSKSMSFLYLCDIICIFHCYRLVQFSRRVGNEQNVVPSVSVFSMLLLLL